MVAQYSDDNFELVIVLVETAERQSADEQDCAELQATEDGTVLYDPNHILETTYDMQVNTGSGLLNNEGKWESAPNEGFESWPNATDALASLLGGSR